MHLRPEGNFGRVARLTIPLYHTHSSITRCTMYVFIITFADVSCDDTRGNSVAIVYPCRLSGPIATSMVGIVGVHDDQLISCLLSHSIVRNETMQFMRKLKTRTTSFKCLFLSNSARMKDSVSFRACVSWIAVGYQCIVGAVVVKFTSGNTYCVPV